MSSVAAEATQRKGSIVGVLAFALQVLIAVSVELGDDLARGIFSQHGTMQGIENARAIAGFEAAHSLFVEPAWQLYFMHTHRLFMATIGWWDVARVMNGIYIAGHIGVTLGVAFWVYANHRRYFAILRNTVILTNVFALLVYENFPVAPPRLTTGLIYNHRVFTFQDTLYGALNGGKFVGTQVRYNEFSAMPSVHMAWALIAGASLVFLASRLLPRILGALYPVLMLVAIVVTGNHYIVDAVAAGGVALLAFALAMGIDRRSVIQSHVEYRCGLA